VRNIIQQISVEFINKITEYFGNSNINIEDMEKELLVEAKACTAKLSAAYIEEIDLAILADKKGRKKAGFVVERRGDERQIQTKIGEIAFKRTYYCNKSRDEYAYLADQVVGIEGYSRVSSGLGLSLVSAARDMSYQKACNHITEGQISRQTVMHKIRESEAEEEIYTTEKRQVKNLHIDADEAHITLCGGRKSIVPLISVYEGIERKGKRGECKSVFHISEYGKSPDELWEQALTEIEQRYKLDGTTIYLHGDGGNWIKTGTQWIPNAIFVLDKYHKNKAIKEMTAGLENNVRKAYDKEIREALFIGETRFFKELTQSIALELPERKDKIEKSAKYLNKFMHGISICNTDSEANNGGATEPHISHVLASRLSSRPMAWSKNTLKQLAPILASGSEIRLKKPIIQQQLPLHRNAARAASKAFLCRGTVGMPLPDSVGTLSALSGGKITPLLKALKAFN